MEYKISKVGFFSEEVYGKNSNHRVVVNFEGQEKDYSAFVKEKPNVGDIWEGTLEKAEKNDKIYHNFKFGEDTHVKNAPATGNVMLEKIFAEVYATRISVQSILQNLQEKGIVSKSDTSPYSLKDEGFNASEIPF